MRTIALALSLAFLVGPAHAITMPTPPAGFKQINTGPAVAQMRAMGLSDIVTAEKANAGWPNCTIDPKINLTYSWSLVGSQKNIELMAKAPEDPVHEAAGTRSEPAGKQTYKGGVMWWRKDTTLAAGTSCGTIVTYSGSWAGFASGKMLSVSVTRVYGSKQAGQGLLDATIDKLIAAVGGAHP